MWISASSHSLPYFFCCFPLIFQPTLCTKQELHSSLFLKKRRRRKSIVQLHILIYFNICTLKIAYYLATVLSQRRKKNIQPGGPKPDWECIKLMPLESAVSTLEKLKYTKEGTSWEGSNFLGQLPGTLNIIVPTSHYYVCLTEFTRDRNTQNCSVNVIQD